MKTNLTFSNDSMVEDSNVNGSVEQVRLILPYSVILLLAVLGNVLVIVTLAVNKRMRTVTNVFLLNLAISDLLLGVFCIPFTLTGVLLRKFVFGAVMCRLISYLQAVSVSVSAWTLVSMSIERYYAICHPLKSRQWQTLSHAYKMIAIVWSGSLICMFPIAYLSKLQSIKGTDKYKCRENWPNLFTERLFTIFLDVVLLVVPLVIMSVTYSLIIRTLWKTIRPIHDFEIRRKSNFSSEFTESTAWTSDKLCHPVIGKEHLLQREAVRSSNLDRSLLQKKRVIKMLFVVVLEFFICWTPLYTINTISMYDPESVYVGLGYYGISFFQLLAHSSSCCNPITYCFMNYKFRQSFLALFRCQQNRWRTHDVSSLAVVNSSRHLNYVKTKKLYKKEENYVT
ncbi:cholecystokinin receptor-like [Centruroides vittatus]|uniref:cholecystokinin receptor-like n=1 Tax=Centruroides vittatus TaxID=120091 RepID=UPI00350EB482